MSLPFWLTLSISDSSFHINKGILQMHYHCLPSSPHGVLVQGQAVLFPMQLPDDVPEEGSKWWMTYLAPWEICGIKGWCSQLLSSSCSSPICHSLLKSESTDEKVLPLSLTCSLSTPASFFLHPSSSFSMILCLSNKFSFKVYKATHKESVMTIHNGIFSHKNAWNPFMCGNM